MKKRFTIVVTMIILIITSTITAFGTVTDDEGYIEIRTPFENAVYYAGDQVPVDFSVYDTWSDCYSRPVERIRDHNYEDLIHNDLEIADVDDWSDYSGYIDLGGYRPGKYYYSINILPVNEDGSEVDNFGAIKQPYAEVPFTIKKFSSPTGLMVKAGKKKITISFFRTNGAAEYQIYRSTKKNSGYKRIATIEDAEYIDKKVKKGVSYYYKVRAIRTMYGTVKSPYSSPKKSGKVK